MKTFIKIFVLILIACNYSNQNMETGELKDLNNKYWIEDILIKTRNDATTSGISLRKKTLNKPETTILQYTIYVRDKGRDLRDLKEVADRGFVAVIAYTRGKRYSQDEIFPYEFVADDTHDVVDWISKQEWSNGKVGMYGGSYNGFSQWAALKKMHPALKTIVPYVANRPGKGLPFENNIFVTPNYYWSLFVSNNKYLDHKTGNDRVRFRKMRYKWWETGVAFKKLDSLDGVPNRLFQRWIKHPSFDHYWQEMTPHKSEFSEINIPILSIDGYYNDSQNSGLSYLRDHYEYHSNPEHYLIIGPYSHFGAQRNGDRILNGYEVDKDALINTKEITFQWFDYIFKGGQKPKILKNKINYQVMGANEWRSASSLKKMANGKMKLYLTNQKNNKFFSLNFKRPDKEQYFYQEVDFADRETSTNNYYPDPIIQNELDMSSGFFFLSDEFTESVIISGSFSGVINASINKKDMDIGVTLYELMPNGNYFHLSYFIGRASYANDISKRNLLTPDKKTAIPFSNSHLVSKKLSKGSRLVVAINVNKNPFSPLNYGTGKDVMEETIEDAVEPLKVKWFNDSYISIPIQKD